MAEEEKPARYILHATVRLGYLPQPLELSLGLWGNNSVAGRLAHVNASRLLESQASSFNSPIWGRAEFLEVSMKLFGIFHTDIIGVKKNSHSVR